MESTRAERLQNELEHLTVQNRELERINAQLKSANQVHAAYKLNETGGLGPTLKSYRHEAKKWVGGLEVNFTKGTNLATTPALLL